MRARAIEEGGFTIVEVLVAIFIVSMAAVVTFGLLADATRNVERASANQIAVDFAEQEMERLRSEPDELLAMTTVPGHSTNSFSPAYRLRGEEFALSREPLGEYKNLVYNGSEIEGVGTTEAGNFISKGTVVPVEPFESGDVKGKIFRYVVWRNDAPCGSACPTQQDYKQIVVAVRVDNAPNDASHHGYFEVQSKFINPRRNSETDPRKTRRTTTSPPSSSTSATRRALRAVRPNGSNRLKTTSCTTRSAPVQSARKPATKNPVRPIR